MTEDMLVASDTVLLGRSVLHSSLHHSQVPFSWQTTDTVVRGQETDFLSLIELKRLAEKMLPRKSTLRRLILSERDYMYRDTAVAKIEIFLKLLYQELEGSD